jgi:hypothetical protein
VRWPERWAHCQRCGTMSQPPPSPEPANPPRRGPKAPSLLCLGARAFVQSMQLCFVAPESVAVLLLSTLTCCGGATGEEQSPSNGGGSIRALWHERHECEESGQKREESCIDGCVDASDACLNHCVTSLKQNQQSCVDQYNAEYEGITGHPPSSGSDAAGDTADVPMPTAQHPGVPPAGFTARDGTQLRCQDGQGKVVTVRFDPGAPFSGFTQLTPMGWLITFRPGPAASNWDSFTTANQKFLFAHECGHVNDGDGGPTKETSANRWGAKFAQDNYKLSKVDWAEVKDALLKYFPVPNPPYPAGATQWRDIQRVLGDDVADP